MENRRILIDTSIIIDFLRKQKKEKSWLWKIRENYTCFMSAITLFELLSGAKTDQHLEDIEKITKWIKSIDLNNETATVAASILRNLKERNQIIDYRDIFIAATAKHYHLTLATLNISHFNRIKEITLLDVPKK